MLDDIPSETQGAAEPADDGRPPPGLARGLHEAPASFFFALLAITLTALLLWALRHPLRKRLRR